MTATNHNGQLGEIYPTMLNELNCTFGVRFSRLYCCGHHGHGFRPSCPSHGIGPANWMHVEDASLREIRRNTLPVTSHDRNMLKTLLWIVCGQSDLITVQRVITWRLSLAWPAVVHWSSPRPAVLMAPWEYGTTATSFFGMCCRENRHVVYYRLPTLPRRDHPVGLRSCSKSKSFWEVRWVGWHKFVKLTVSVLSNQCYILLGKYVCELNTTKSPYPGVARWCSG